MARNKYDIDEELDKEFNFSHYKRLGTFIRPYKKPLFWVLLSILLANAATLVGPYLTKIALDRTLPEKRMGELWLLAGIFLLSLVVIGWCMKYRIYAITEIGQDVLRDMRKAIFDQLQKLPFSYFDNRPHGKILIRVVNYINTLSDLLSTGLINLLSDVLMLVLTLGMMAFIDWKLTLYSLVLLPILGLLVYAIKKGQRKAYQDLSNKQSNLNAYIHESIAGIKITQSFAREERNEEIFREVNTAYRASWMHAVKILFLLWPAVQNISVIATSLIYFIGIQQWGGVEVSLGTLIAFVTYLNNFWNPVTNIGNFYNSLVTATAYLERIFETIDEVPDIQDLPGAQAAPSFNGAVSFEHVTFGYDASKTILQDVSFEVAPGDSIALVGPTGAGKTTVINLLSRFYDVNQGAVKIDGYDVRELTLHSLRKQMGVMLQDTFIFTGTIMENIRYGKLDATVEEVVAAAKIVQADTFIQQLKQGYETKVEERGTTLSAGQRQLISFARALLADPKILILDEATASIDTKTEEQLQRGLQELLKGRTSFIIAHRLSTIKNSSRIFYIDQGKIMEAGTHEELMALQGAYYALYQAQYQFIQAGTSEA